MDWDIVQRLWYYGIWAKLGRLFDIRRHYTTAAAYRKLGANMMKVWISQLRLRTRSKTIVITPGSSCAECADLLSLAPAALRAPHSHLA